MRILRPLRVRNRIKSLVLFVKNYLVYRSFVKRFHGLLRKQGFSEDKVLGEDEYLQKWHRLSRRVEPWSYRFFSHYMGCVPTIVPEDIGHTIIEPELNPMRYRDFYADKNAYPLYIPKEALPDTLICRVNGSQLLDSDYRLLTEPVAKALRRYGQVIVKPTIDTHSGLGVMLFVKRHDVWHFVKDETIVLSDEFLLSYGSDFVVQEVLAQHPALAQFCPSCINTLRVAVYRSIKDERPHVVASVIRIGKRGEFVDNAHAGGCIVGIDQQTGRLGDKAFDQYGNVYMEWNGVDFGSSAFVIPYWERVKEFACTLADHILHMRLVAFDLTVDTNGNPRLVEFNVKSFGYWAFMYVNQNPLGEFTDEIIDYCAKK